MEDEGGVKAEKSAIATFFQWVFLFSHCSMEEEPSIIIGNNNNRYWAHEFFSLIYAPFFIYKQKCN